MNKTEFMINGIYYYQLEIRIQEMMLNLLHQGFIDDYIKEYYPTIPLGYGLQYFLFMQVARGEACKLIFQEGFLN